MSCDILWQPLFAFLYKEQFPVDGWKVYDPVAEYKRQVTTPSDKIIFKKPETGIAQFW